MNIALIVSALFLFHVVGRTIELLKNVKRVYQEIDLLDSRQLRDEQLRDWLSPNTFSAWNGKLPPAFDYSYHASLGKYCSLALDFVATNSPQLTLPRAIRLYRCFP